jgi:hypothetical protein
MYARRPDVHPTDDTRHEDRVRNDLEELLDLHYGDALPFDYVGADPYVVARKLELAVENGHDPWLIEAMWRYFEAVNP